MLSIDAITDNYRTLFSPNMEYVNMILDARKANKCFIIPSNHPLTKRRRSNFEIKH